jgi:gamma-glutamyl-gamma-aminobutyrate hydrolase PuuD
MEAPLVAIPAYRLVPGRVQGWSAGAFAVPDSYVHAAQRAGMRPVILTEPESDPAGVLDLFDALLLLGGGDIDPARYGAEPHAETYGVDRDRDALEIGLIRAAADTGLPTLGICRGAQILNVAFGGTLLQHLPEIAGLGLHGVPGGGQPAMHDVKVSPGSLLSAATGKEVLDCSSHHHQAIDRLGEGLVATGWADDGLVEALEREGGWMVAVQWHPEDTAPADPSQQALFDALGGRAREFAKAQSRSK